MNRRAFFGAILPVPGALRRGAGYLWSRQSSGGGWHSETYGLLRSGQSLTPLIVNALLDAGAGPNDPRIQRAAGFLARNVSADGAVGLSGDDYPCYATALTLRVFVRTRNPLAARLIDWLRTQQMSPGNGWAHRNEAFGAWGIGGAPRVAPESGHIDLSMTRHVLEALSEAGVPAADPAMRNALVFVDRCQNSDGGFFFSTVETGANKAGETAFGFASYATSTADGLLSQIAAGGVDIRPAVRWMRANDQAELPAGFDSIPGQRYAESLRYYYAGAATRAFRAAGLKRETPFATGLVRAQRVDGSWQNMEPLVKEDDPLIATAFAVSALAKWLGLWNRIRPLLPRRCDRLRAPLNFLMNILPLASQAQVNQHLHVGFCERQRLGRGALRHLFQQTAAQQRKLLHCNVVLPAKS